ncbi:MAG TPA: asparagine synthase-related protein [Candidatus Saccharimonadales bacterium]|nr:asparagine synthase-related protein [Candidatus Saccharimonadales bacterium]
MQTFLEGTFFRPQPDVTLKGWNDYSTADYYVFESAAGSLRLRRRGTYPSTFVVCYGPWLYFGYGNQQVAFRALEQPLDKLPESVFYDEEFLCIGVNGDTGDCIIQRDARCTLPLFVGQQPDRLVLCNKYERVCELLDTKSLHLHEYGLTTLLLGAFFDAAPIVKEIDILIDRVRATLFAGKYQKHLPPHGSIIHTVQHRDGEPQEFRKRLEQTFDAHWERYANGAKAGMELSGGFDSSSLYGYYASRGREFYPVSLEYADASSRNILHDKLNNLQARFGGESHLIPMDVRQDFPLASYVYEGDRSVFPGEILYQRSLQKMAAYLKGKGVQVVFQGHGGDELFDNVPHYERQDFKTPLFLESLKPPLYLTPDFYRVALATFASSQKPSVPLLSQSAAISGTYSNNAYIDHDIWPVRPLADPRLYLYCQSLDIQYRMNRNIMRAYLHARDFPKAIINQTSESFDPFFIESVSFGLTAVFTELMQHSVLAQKGLVNAAMALEQWRTICASSSKVEHVSELFKLYCLLVAEINFRQLGLG